MFKAIKLKKVVVFVIIFLLIFVFLYYKKILFGNNIIKNRNESKINNILNSMEKYIAEIDVTVKSNKTQNSYTIYQEVNNNYSMQEVKQGNNVEGLKIELNQNNLKIYNSKLGLSKIYEEYNNLLDNAMFLNTFANDYKNEENSSNYYYENEDIILEIELKSDKNTYIKYKKLYVNNETLKPTKLEIKDNTKKETICILYNNVELQK